MEDENINDSIILKLNAEAVIIITLITFLNVIVQSNVTYR